MKNTLNSAGDSTLSRMASNKFVSPAISRNTILDTPSTSPVCPTETVEVRIAMLRETAEILETSAKNLHDRLLSVMVPAGPVPSEGQDLRDQAPKPVRCDVVESLARVDSRLQTINAILAEIIAKLRL